VAELIPCLRHTSLAGPPGIRFLENLHDLAFAKSRPFHLNLLAKSCQNVLLPACLATGEAYGITDYEPLPNSNRALDIAQAA
jgi:hypothetical protein